MIIDQKTHDALTTLGWSADYRMLYQDYYLTVQLDSGTNIRYSNHYCNWHLDVIINGTDLKYYDAFYIGDPHEHNVVWKGHISDLDEFKLISSQVIEAL